MTRRISLIIGIAVIALMVVVPAALGAGRLPNSHEHPDFWNYESNAKVADTSPGIAPQDLAKLFVASGPGFETNNAEGTVDSGTEIEWQQVGISLGIGILLVLGVGLAMRVAHVRPFAH
jgi:hypothetical protein